MTTPDLTTFHDNRLRELVDLATLLTGRARRARLDALMRRARSVGFTLHAARDVLDSIGSEYIDAARAYISAGAKILHDLADQIDRAEITGDHSDRLTGLDVLAWCEGHCIPLSRFQQRLIEHGA